MMGPSTRLLLRRLAHHKTLWRAFVAVMRGVGLFIRWYHAWISAADKAHLLADGSNGRDRASHDRWCEFRRGVSWFTLAGGILAAALIWYRLSWAAPLILFGVPAALLGWWGKPADKPVLVEKDILPTKPVVNSDTIRQIVASATTGIKADDWQRIRVLGQGITWDKPGVWWTVRLELPGTVPGAAVANALPRLMSGLGVGPSQLIVTVDPNNAGIVTIQGSETDPWEKPSQQTPLMTMESHSVWKKTPLGNASDPQETPLYVSLLFTGWLVGAIPRMGKTNLVRLLALASALDPWCDLVFWDLKGGADWRMFTSIATDYGFGHTDKTMRELLTYLERLEKEIDRRSEVMGSLDPERCPEGQLTFELATDPALRLWPIMVFIDEIQWMFQHREYGRKFWHVVENIAKGGQFVGVQLILASQRPDTASIPSAIRDVLGTRAAGKCMTQPSSATILGTEAYKEGFNAAALPRKPGVFIIYGADDTAALVAPQKVRIHRCDIAAARMIVDRAVVLRRDAGRLPQQRKAAVVPAIVRQAREFQGTAPFIPSMDLLQNLNELPQYAEKPWTPQTLALELQKHGFVTRRPELESGRRAVYDFLSETRQGVDNSV
jgi:S-DNA-T family DNA segregation ATPase FtsK/SpoIIIE